MRNTGPARFLIPLGIVLIIFGIILLGMKTDNYVERVGKVTNVEEYIILPRTRRYWLYFFQLMIEKDCTERVQSFRFMPALLL